jgi:PAS domain-containing protein
VTRFNALAGRIFGLLPNDIGQFLYRRALLPRSAAPAEWVEGVVARNDSRVEHVHQRGFHYLMQIDAYRDERRNAGAVLTSPTSPTCTGPRPPGHSEARFRQVWDSSVDGLAVVSAEGRMVLVNPALEHMFGYLPGELTGAPVELLVPDQARQPAIQRELYRDEPELAQT